MVVVELLVLKKLILLSNSTTLLVLVLFQFVCFVLFSNRALQALTHRGVSSARLLPHFFFKSLLKCFLHFL